jgi:hypothetical protein
MQNQADEKDRQGKWLHKRFGQEMPILDQISGFLGNKARNWATGLITLVYFYGKINRLFWFQAP